MKMKEVRKLNNDEIVVETTRLRRRLFDLRSQAVTEKIEDTSQGRKARKDLARVLTEANDRVRAATPAVERPAAKPAAVATRPAAKPRVSKSAKPAADSSTKKKA